MSKYWQCPACGSLLEKSFVGFINPLTVIGTGTCPGCRADYPQREIYGGRYDVEVVDRETWTIRQIGPGIKSRTRVRGRKRWWQFWR